MPTAFSRRLRQSVSRLALLTAVLFAFASTDARAQQPRQITFSEAVRIALDQNIALQQAENQAELDAINVSRARMNFFPDLSLSTNGRQSYGRQFSQIEGGIRNEQTQNVSADISSNINLFNGFNDVATYRQARLNLQAGEYDLERARQTVVFTVMSDYVTLVERREQIRVQEENLASVQSQLEQIEAFTELGARPISDLYQQQAIVANAELALLQAQQQYQIAESNIIQTLQLDPFEPYEFEAPAVEEVQLTPEQYELNTLLRNAYENRPDIRASDLGIQAAREGIRVSRSNYLPTIGLNFGYGTSWSSAFQMPDGARMPVSDQLDANRGGGIGLALSIPLFDRLSARNSVQQARVQFENARLQREDMQQDIAVQVRQAYLDYLTAQKSVDVAEVQVQAAQLALQAEEERYAVGVATLVEVSQARAQYVEAASQQVQAKYDFIFREKLIDYYLGVLDPQQPLL